MGSTYEKIARRVNKHLCKDYFLFVPVMSKVRGTMQKMIEKAIKEHKISSVTMEQVDNFMAEEGTKVTNKYSKKL